MGLCAALCPVDALRGSAIVDLGRCGSKGAEQLYSRRGIQHSALPGEGSNASRRRLRRIVVSPQDRYLAKKGIGAGEGGWSKPFVPFASKRVCHAEIRRVRHDGVICH
jgi:hypothetical protein